MKKVNTETYLVNIYTYTKGAQRSSFRTITILFFLAKKYSSAVNKNGFQSIWRPYNLISFFLCAPLTGNRKNKQNMFRKEFNSFPRTLCQSLLVMRERRKLNILINRFVIALELKSNRMNGNQFLHN